jgi:hypothetical protein
MILRPKRKEKGVQGDGPQGGRGGAVQTFLCSPPIEFGGTGMHGLSHSKCCMSSAALRPAAPTDSASPAHQHLSYRTLMTLELGLVARFLENALAEAGTSGTIPHAL